MSPTNATSLGGIGRPRTTVERRPFGPTITEPADALRTSASRVLRPAEPGNESEGGPE